MINKICRWIIRDEIELLETELERYREGREYWISQYKKLLGKK